MAEYQESTTTIFEWQIKGLKNIFESSRGETKSRVTRSLRFGGGKWQILFYANSGEGNFVSLYLNCEPTQEEKENAIGGKWYREGLFKFSFELRNTTKSTLFNMKEACDHTFSYRTQNWGWAQFAKRDTVFYSSPAVRQADSFVIVCTITSAPTPPTNSPRVKKRPVPLSMLDYVGQLLDDPLYSDVEFVFPNKAVNGKRGERRIYACKRLLTRAEYFSSMFNSGFSENSAAQAGPLSAGSPSSESDDPFHHENFLDDSDIEDEAIETGSVTSANEDEDLNPEEFTTPTDERPVSDLPRKRLQNDGTFVEIDSSELVDADETGASDSMKSKLSEEPSKPALSDSANNEKKNKSEKNTVAIPGPPKARVVVTDVAYSTYRAVLYYLYTDAIIFAPLQSSFLHKPKRHGHPPSQRVTGDVPIDNSRDGEDSISNTRPNLTRQATQVQSAIYGDVRSSSIGVPSAPTTRAQWIKDWESDNPGRPSPCSAKAVYRLADKLDLTELKERAKEHIVKSLTVTNVPHEMFSSFSAAFDDIRKIQVDYFLANWGEIRGSEAMRNIWQQLRVGRHPGFEEVWPLIVQNLEYRASPVDGAVGDEREGVPSTE